MATVNTVVNYVTNPSFESGTTGVLVGPGVTVDIGAPAASGTSSLEITGTTPALTEADSWVGEAVFTGAQVGESVTFQAAIAGDTGLYARLVLQFRDATTVLFSDTGPRVALTGTLVVHEHTGTVPTGTDNTRLLVYVSGSDVGATPPNAWEARTDSWMVTRDAPVPGILLAEFDAVWSGETLEAYDTHWDGATLSASDTNPLDRS